MLFKGRIATMTDIQQKHPLHGLGLEALLNELVEHYDWEILAEQIPIKCFSTFPSVSSCVKFLRKTTWARERVEAFYLYRFKRISLPTEEQHKLPPREREISEDQLGREPSSIRLGDPEFFDDPDTGPVFKKQSRRDKPVKDKPVNVASAPKEKIIEEPQDKKEGDNAPSSSGNGDPWGKWR